MKLTVFSGPERFAAGTLGDIAGALVRAVEVGHALTVFDENGRVRDLDLRGTAEDIVWRNADPVPPKPGRGRPKLGVVAKEVTLLPRHWDWLRAQRGGASATLRRLIDAARKAEDGDARTARDAAYRFMTVMAGDLPGYEDAIRALYADDPEALTAQVQAWPPDIAAHAILLANGHGP